MNSSFFLVRWLFQAMDWVYRQMCSLFSTGGWVVVLTIFLFTLAIKLLTIFSDIKSRKSSMQMQAIQPEIDKLKKKYGNDPQKLSTEQRKLMKERGVSSLGGCLPMLIMMPLLFMFFAAFRAWSNQQTLDLMLKIEAGQGPEAFAASRFLWITNIWRLDNLKAGGTLMTGQEFWTTFGSTNNVKDFTSSRTTKRNCPGSSMSCTSSRRRSPKTVPCSTCWRRTAAQRSSKRMKRS